MDKSEKNSGLSSNEVGAPSSESSQIRKLDQSAVERNLQPHITPPTDIRLDESGWREPLQAMLVEGVGWVRFTSVKSIETVGQVGSTESVLVGWLESVGLIRWIKSVGWVKDEHPYDPFYGR
ncbi:hypothetical protein AK830_g4112 [Neonectria ditissima]|uniref:Uncharacterized protein n=1 Tax=Neonectria ditissima TaxID=78410 RepID=A0A0N8H7R0_9HYPO|nr:hypothetical protein AK830_g4112 [Neonectria ditissima]